MIKKSKNPWNKKIIIDLILIFLIFIFIILVIYLIVTLKKDSILCLSNPIKYYETIKNTSCYCQNFILHP